MHSSDVRTLGARHGLHGRHRLHTHYPASLAGYLLRLVKDGGPRVLDELAARERSPQRLGDRRSVRHVVLPQEGSDVLRGLLRMVKGHLAEEVVTDVGVRDVVDDVVDDGSERPVYSAKRSAEPVPFAAAEVRQKHVRVLQIRDEHEVRVGDHEWHDVVLGYGHEAEGVDGVPDAGEGREEPDVGGDDVHAVALLEHLSKNNYWEGTRWWKGPLERGGWGEGILREVSLHACMCGVKMLHITIFSSFGMATKGMYTYAKRAIRIKGYKSECR